MAPLCYAAKFDPFLSLYCAPFAFHPGAIQGKEGISFCHLATLTLLMSLLIFFSFPLVNTGVEACLVSLQVSPSRTKSMAFRLTGSLKLLDLCLHLLLHGSPLSLEVLLRLSPGRGLHLGHLTVQLSLYGGQVRRVILPLSEDDYLRIIYFLYWFCHTILVKHFLQF